MDATIYHDADGLVGTQYIEYGPGPYRRQHWQPGFRFVRDDAFVYAEGVLQRALPTYDHFGVTAVPRAVGRTVAARWRSLAEQLPRLSAEEAHRALELSIATHHLDAADVAEHRAAITSLLGALAEDWDALLAVHDELTVLGL